MKRLIPLLFLFTVTISSAQVQITRVEDNPDMLPKEITITKENQMNLDEVKGFVLVSIQKSGKKANYLIKGFRENLEYTPFEVIYRNADIEKYRKRAGYISIFHNVISNSSNFSASWIFRDHTGKNIFSFNSQNIGVTEALNQLGISTY